MKKFIAYFVKYPVAVNIFILGFFIFGYLGYQNLQSSLFPLSVEKNIVISVTYPGASPEEVEEGVVEKIERNLKGIEGVDRVSSVSQENFGSVNVEILSGFDINLILDEVNNAVDRISTFPVTIEPPVIEKVKPTRAALTFVITGKDVPLTILKEYAEDVEDDLLRLDGISQITLSGFPDSEIEIALSEEKLRSYDLSFEEVSTAVASANILISGGSIKTDKEEFLLRADNKGYFANELQQIVIKSTNDGGQVLLRDVAEIRDIFSDSPDRIYYKGETCPFRLP